MTSAHTAAAAAVAAVADTAASSPVPVPVAIHGLHHFAWRCRDAEETRRFYEDLLGLPLVHVIRADHVPSTGAYCPYVHIFFRLGDGTASEPSPNTPTWVNHLALRVDSPAALMAARAYR